MILPTKHIPTNRALLGVGALILQDLDNPKTVSKLWDTIRLRRTFNSPEPALDYRWFVLALDFLFILGAIHIDRGLLTLNRKQTP